MREWAPEIFRRSASDARIQMVELADASARIHNALWSHCNGGGGCEHRGEVGDDMLMGFKGGGLRLKESKILQVQGGGGDCS